MYNLYVEVIKQFLLLVLSTSVLYIYVKDFFLSQSSCWIRFLCTIVFFDALDVVNILVMVNNSITKYIFLLL